MLERQDIDKLTEDQLNVMLSELRMRKTELNNKISDIDTDIIAIKESIRRRHPAENF